MPMPPWIAGSRPAVTIIGCGRHLKVGNAQTVPDKPGVKRGYDDGWWRHTPSTAAAVLSDDGSEIDDLGGGKFRLQGGVVSRAGRLRYHLFGLQPPDFRVGHLHMRDMLTSGLGEGLEFVGFLLDIDLSHDKAFHPGTPALFEARKVSRS
ncbi:hypothetical protein [Telmatospirillum sp.]|uniref:hypothetical protein n=1 Tax=Telmatospirillum sp. TaxID=2079197 RepID=UPI002842A6E2|nr:hypothetical protein [Telmatospirillum sp.]MDR3435672.1 hypothetical protein [Telmatospirillum sp.]